MKVFLLLPLITVLRICGLLGSTLKLSRERKTWRDARQDCESFGGHIARTSNLEGLKLQLNNNELDFAFEDDEEAWIGAVLIDKGWKWADSAALDNDKVKNDLFSNHGCFQQEYWMDATTFKENNAEKCFGHCQWKGAIGLKKDFCICERNLRNITATNSSLCHYSCDGNLEQVCGGLQAVSVYQSTGRMVEWAKDEPKPFNDCVFLRRQEHSSIVAEWHSSDCVMDLRYLCYFEHDDKCGLRSSCLRWSSEQRSWEEAKRKCRVMNGRLAEVSTYDIISSPDIRTMPPGDFWIGMRRARKWQWITGGTVGENMFYRHELQQSHFESCAVLHKLNSDLGLSARSCQLKRKYLCEYESINGPPATMRLVGGITSGNATKSQIEDVSTTNAPDMTATPTSKVDGSLSFTDSDILSTCLYIGIGFVAGMGFVLFVGFLVFLALRCSRKDEIKLHTSSSDRHRGDNSRVCYNANQVSVQFSGGKDNNDDTYDTVYDMQADSPFRRTQKLIRLGSANSWKRSNVQKAQSSASENLDYTWRGLIDGKIEVVNTALRNQPELSNSSRLTDDCYTVHSPPSVNNVTVHNRAESDKTSDYEFPTDATFKSKPVADVTPVSMATIDENGPDNDCHTPPFPSISELNALFGDESESIYATVKKTLSKLNESTL
ncbi:hypothetical protein CHS0354_005297 [Potamilus streckersoni]|uniref:C-type lectin domain-containing protein n=1 Tax=Potamilus streckersoni TaxID=2493646 RepID=A0AAE0SG24_9BIVA|nr:hypothetical protein CHS0354_005297 [Potamilus streckersoni]